MMGEWYKIIEKLTPFPVLGKSIPAFEYGGVDLSGAYHRRIHSQITGYDGLAAYIQQTLTEKKIKVAYGGYQEKRNLYNASEHFNNETENRDRHLGVDLWTEAGRPVFTSFPARVHSFGYNDRRLDYGATIILEYDLEIIHFYTLYGHLSVQSLTGIERNNILAAGSAFATLGARTENGGWPPHLHLQIILDIKGWNGDYPGVCSEKEAKIYFANCPSPLWLCGLK